MVSVLGTFSTHRKRSRSWRRMECVSECIFSYLRSTANKRRFRNLMAVQLPCGRVQLMMLGFVVAHPEPAHGVPEAGLCCHDKDICQIHQKSTRCFTSDQPMG